MKVMSKAHKTIKHYFVLTKEEYKFFIYLQIFDKIMEYFC